MRTAALATLVWLGVLGVSCGSSEDGKIGGSTGRACSAASDCGTGFCVAGVCCNDACEAGCMACNLPGHVGICAPIPEGAKARPGSCQRRAPSTCGDDGTCDGKGACRRFALGTKCKDETCDGNMFTAASTCDGNGRCVAETKSIPCAPFRCANERRCLDSCTSDAQCAEGSHCVGGTCGPRVDGSECRIDSDCTSGHCADGVCCATACGGCRACNLPGARGVCSLVPVGQDPHRKCPLGDGICMPGGCSGDSDECLAPTGIICEEACSSGRATVRRCRSDGSCGEPVETSCAPYACGDRGCLTRCDEGRPCDDSSYCTRGECRARKGAGERCSAKEECADWQTCLDGVCCQQSECPTCQNCGAGGQCTTTVTSAPDPTGRACVGAYACNAAGQCTAPLGTACDTPDDCDSGLCIDGVCCESPCPMCMNCAAGGKCTMKVVDADDVTGTTCAYAMTCDANGTCKDRWRLVASTSMLQSLWAAAVDTKLYIAASNQTDSAAPGIVAYDVIAGTFSTVPNNPALGGPARTSLVGANGKLYFAGSSGVVFTPGSGWSALPHAAEAETDMPAHAVFGTRYYRLGGSNTKTALYLDTTTNTWVTSGVAELPAPLSQICGGSIGDKVYVFGGGQPTTYVYDATANSWSALPPSGNFTGSCFPYSALAASWRGKLVVADPYSAALHVFDPASGTWGRPIPPPAYGPIFVPLAPSNGRLYVVTSDWAQTVSIFEWVYD